MADLDYKDQTSNVQGSRCGRRSGATNDETLPLNNEDDSFTFDHQPSTPSAPRENRDEEVSQGGNSTPRSSPLIGIVLFLVLAVGGGGGGLAYFFLSKGSADNTAPTSTSIPTTEPAQQLFVDPSLPSSADTTSPPTSPTSPAPPSPTLRPTASPKVPQPVPQPIPQPVPVPQPADVVCNGFPVDTTTRISSLSGSLLPACLGDLTLLTYLELGRKSLTGRIPPQLGSLTALTYLGLWLNQLTGTIPTQLGSLTALTVLNLGNNQLTGTIPTQLGSLTALTVLYLRDNQLTGTIPEWVSDISNTGLTGNNFVGRF